MEKVKKSVFDENGRYKSQVCYRCPISFEQDAKIEELKNRGYANTKKEFIVRAIDMYVDYLEDNTNKKEFFKNEQLDMYLQGYFEKYVGDQTNRLATILYEQTVQIAMLTEMIIPLIELQGNEDELRKRAIEQLDNYHFDVIQRYKKLKEEKE